MGGEDEEVVEQKEMEISLKDLSKKLEEFAQARDWEKYHSPRNLLLAMVTLLSLSSMIVVAFLDYFKW